MYPVNYFPCSALLWLFSLQWRHNGPDSISNHQPHDCLHNRVFRRRSKETSKLRVTGLCAGNSPETGEFPAQMASNAEKVSIWWRHHVSVISRSYVLFSHILRVASLGLGQSDDYPSTSEVTRKDMGKIDLSQPTEIRLRLILVHICPLKTRSCNVPNFGGKNWRLSWHHDNSRFFSVRTYFACVTLGQFDWPNLIRVKLSKIVLKSRNRQPSRWIFLETTILVWNL